MGIFYNLSKVTKLMSFILKVDRTSTYVSNTKGCHRKIFIKV